MSGATDRSSPELMDPAPGARESCAPGDPRGCALCGDEALPARVLEVRPALGVATVAMLTSAPADAGLDVALDLVDGIAIGDVVLVHQGFVISRMDVP